jgi:hypothetical protein
VTDSFAHGLVGVTLDGRYRLDAVLGEGGMGAVFRATHLAMDRKVAVKLLKPHLTSDEGALQRFAREARATFKVDSPHAVKVLDFGVTPVGDYYMVLEYLDGRTVHRELDIDGPFAPTRVAHIARQALHALGAAHRHGLIHRDVKPDNLLLMRVGNDPDYTKILDFGVAKLMQGASDRSQLALTAAGMVFGTPEFMSPEQACGHEIDSRSDLYSLAATMFVMLTGTPLFEGKTALEILTHHVRTPAPHLAMARPELAAYAELDDLLQRCLAKRREDRPATAAAMASLIERLEPGLARSGAAAPPGAGIGQAPTPPRVFHRSSYVRALSADADAQSTAGMSAASLGLPRAVKRSRRGKLWIGGVAVASLLGLGLGVAVCSTSRTASMDPGDPEPVASSTGSASAALPVAAPEPAADRPADRPAADGSAAPRGTVGELAPADRRATTGSADHAPGFAAPVHAGRGTGAEEHLRAAESAFRDNNLLRQLAEADLALRADPRSARARYLLGDALIKSGDIDRGCKYLHAIKRMSLARERARAAGCPGD